MSYDDISAEESSRLYSELDKSSEEIPSMNFETLYLKTSDRAIPIGDLLEDRGKLEHYLKTGEQAIPNGVLFKDSEKLELLNDVVERMHDLMNESDKTSMTLEIGSFNVGCCICEIMEVGIKKGISIKLKSEDIPFDIIGEKSKPVVLYVLGNFKQRMNESYSSLKKPGYIKHDLEELEVKRYTTVSKVEGNEYRVEFATYQTGAKVTDSQGNYKAGISPYVGHLTLTKIG